MLKVEVQPNAIYGGFARRCVAHTTDDDDNENTYVVTDNDGCATDPAIFGKYFFNLLYFLIVDFSSVDLYFPLRKLDVFF